jgi:GAF domain-containing protein
MTILRRFFPGNSPEIIDPMDSLKIWQEKALQTYLYFGIIAGIGLSLFSNVQAGTRTSIANFVSGILFAVSSLILAAFRNKSFWARSISSLVLMFIFMNVIFATSGWGVGSLFMLVSFSFLSSILLFKKSSRIGFGISLVTLLFWAVLRFSDMVQSATTSHSFFQVLAETLITLLAGAIGNFAILSLKTHHLNQKSRINSLQNENLSLTHSLEVQSSDLERRLNQLTTASEISQSISTLNDSQVLIQQVAELIKNRFNLYYVGVFLLDNSKEYAILQYGTGDAGQRMLAASHRLAVGGYSMIGWATQMRKARVALDVGDEAVHFDNPFLPDTRSELALPIISGDNVLGALTIQSEKPNAFDENDILTLQSLANSLAIGLENANSFQRTQQALNEIRVLNRAYVRQAWWEGLSSSTELKYDFDNNQMQHQSKNLKTVEVPIKIREEVIGHFNLQMVESQITDDQQEFLELIASQTSIALENARLIEETQLRAIQEQKLNELTAQFAKSISIEEIIKAAATVFGNLPEVSEASVSLLPPEEINLRDLKSLPEREQR